VKEPGAGRAEANARRREAARLRLIEAAQSVFAEMGYHPARVSDITGRAQVSHGLFYNYFASKADIFREVAHAVDRELIASMDAYLETTVGETQAGMRAAIAANFRAFSDNARLIHVITDAAHSDPEIAGARLALNKSEAARLAGAIRRLQQEGVCDPGLDPEIAAVALGAMGWRFAERWFIDGELDCDLETGVEQFLKLVLNALGIAPTA
jgi:AcrR family transcriptional regulator